ncbi:BLUF domain-containing protein [Amaricoccus tamworthensis]|uniref:BLUF domain-containing protein n=1 Tax=Amaricoccus tamworthensis TaxID=57002 RepID=UPI003C7D6C90
MLERIIYVSRVAAGVELADVMGILKAARERNASEDISGGLVFHDGWFVQVLEGPQAVVEAAFARIARDPRHVDLVLRSRERALCRLFAGQSMGFRTGTGLNPDVLREFDYRHGFSVEEFPADDLLEFMVHICWPERSCVNVHRPAMVSPDAGRQEHDGRIARQM